MSSNRHKSGKPGKYDPKSYNTGPSLPPHSNSSWSAQNNIHPLTSANKDHSFNESPDVNIDTDDINDIHQVPTKPGTHQMDTYQPEVENQHVSVCNAAIVEGNVLDWMDSELLGVDGQAALGVHGCNESLEPLNYCQVSDDGEESSDDYGDGARCNETPLTIVASVNPEYMPGILDGTISKSLIAGEPTVISHTGFSSSDYPLVSKLDLDYCPSSHDDNSSPPSDEEAGKTPGKILLLGPLSSSSPVAEASDFVPALNSHSSFLISGQQHASSALRSHSDQEHGECPEGNLSTSSLLLPGQPPQPGTIAEREHRKWEAAVDLPNNPYAPERLVHRLSNTRSSTQTAPSRHGIKVDFSEDGEGELDPSLRNGVPPQADLNRYSRDYYISSNSTSRKPSFTQMKSQHKLQQSTYQQPEQPLPQRNSALPLTNGVQEDAGSPSELPKNQVLIHIVGRETQGNTNTSIDTTKPLHRLENAVGVKTSRPSDWKDELKDIQAARVEREVARFQRTIDETQRRWEANYGPKGPTNIQSDSSAEVLHNPRRSAYMVPPRHDLWRTVSVDTINSPAKEKVILEPLQRHISVDNLRLTKVSNLRNLETAEQRHMSSMNTVSSVSSINLNTMNKMSRYQHNPQHRQSVESMSGYSDGESPGDGNESDVSTRTQDETPLLPSVKKLASKFNLASQERVNDLDKHETDGTLTFYGKKNIFLSDKSPTEQPYSRNFTNNLNKRTEKPYNIKEVHSLTARSVPRQFREGLRDPPRIVTHNVLPKSQSNSSSCSPRRDAPSPEHLGIPWGPAAIPVRPMQVPGDTSDDSSAPSGSPRRVPRRRSGGRRDHLGWHTRPECGALTDPALQTVADSMC